MQLRQRFFDRFDGCDNICTWLPLNLNKNGALCVQPARKCLVFRCHDGVTHIADTNRRAVPVRNDVIIKSIRRRQLVVGKQGSWKEEQAMWAKRICGAKTRRQTTCGQSTRPRPRIPGSGLDRMSARKAGKDQETSLIKGTRFRLILTPNRPWTRRAHCSAAIVSPQYARTDILVSLGLLAIADEAA